MIIYIYIYIYIYSSADREALKTSRSNRQRDQGKSTRNCSLDKSSVETTHPVKSYIYIDGLLTKSSVGVSWSFSISHDQTDYMPSIINIDFQPWAEEINRNDEGGKVNDSLYIEAAGWDVE